MDFYVPHYVRFWYFLCANIISLIFTITTLFLLLSDQALRQAVKNHVFIVLLFLGFIYEVTVIPCFLHNDRSSTRWLASRSFYLFWTYCDYSLYSLQIALFAWTTIERHILIFHDSWLLTWKRRLIIHYLPILVIILYYIIYYAIVYYVISCNHPFDSFLAGGIYIPCAFDRTILATWDLMFHQVVPTLIILVFCIGLVLRVIRQKFRTRRVLEWKKHRKMTLQLVTVSMIYVVFNLPWVVVILAYQCGLPAEIAMGAIIIAKFILYNIIFVFPVVCFLSLPEVRRKFITRVTP